MHRTLLITILTTFSFSIHCPTFSQDRPTSSQLARAVKIVWNNPKLKDEVGLLDEQIKELRSIVTEFKSKEEELRKTLVADLAKLRSEGLQGEAYNEAHKAARTKLADSVEAQSENLANAINKILVPPQIKKITQLEFRIRSGGYGAPFILFNKAYSELGMNPMEEKEARLKLVEIKKKYIAEYEKLNKAIYKDVLRSLHKEQAEKLEELIGESVFPSIH